MFKNKLNLRKVVAIAICLAGSATMFAQNKAPNPFDRESFKNDKSVFADKYPQADFVEKSNSTLPALRSGNFKQRLDSVVVPNSLKYEYSYDNKGNPTMLIIYGWKNNAWKKMYKIGCSYDNNGNLTMCISYGWDNSAWVVSRKNEYSYDNNGNQTMDISYGWKNNAWVEDSKHEYSYDNKGNLTMDVGYDWENNVWKEYRKREYEYTYNNGKVMSMIESDFCDFYERKDYKTEYGYDNNGNLTMYIIYKWENNTWVENSKTEYEYDLSVLSSNICGVTNGIFIGKTLVEAKNKTIEMKFYKWNENLQIWQDNNVYTFYYSDVQSSGNVGIVETWRAASLPRIAGYYSLTGAKLAHEPERGMYIILYDNGTSERRGK